MELVFELDDRKYYFHALEDQPDEFLSFNGAEFVLLLCAEPDSVGAEYLGRLFRYLLESNVRYVVCTGSGARMLLRMFDEEVSRGGWDEKRGETILTTAHEGESVEDVVFHFTHLTFPERTQPNNSLMLFSERDRLAEEYLNCLRRSKADSK